VALEALWGFEAVVPGFLQEEILTADSSYFFGQKLT